MCVVTEGETVEAVMLVRDEKRIQTGTWPGMGVLLVLEDHLALGCQRGWSERVAKQRRRQQ